MNKTFCEECRKDVEYKVEPEIIRGKLRGEEYVCTGKKAICIDCGSEIHVAHIEYENMKALYDEYRKRNGIISLEKILEIPEKYNIGKRPLSLLLGWGEMTFSRYCENEMPTKQYSDILQKIYDDPAFYRDLLEKNKDNLKSQQAYEKSKRKVLELLGEEDNTESKLDTIVQYILSMCEDITPLALQKALYYVQGFYYAFEGKFLFDEDCEAWVNGPVYRDVYNRYFSYRYDPLEKSEPFDDSVFSASEKAVLDSVIKYFCCYSGKTLKNFTLLELPWRATRRGLSANTQSNRIISKELIGNYFNDVRKKYRMLNPCDMEVYARAIFNKTGDGSVSHR